MNRSRSTLLFDLPGHYRIRVQGRLSASYSGRLGNMVIATRQPRRQQPITTLTGEVKDQTALLGVLNALYDMGFPLLRVERIGAPPSPEAPNG